MKFTCEVLINKPLQEVAALMDNIENLKHWQDGYISHKHISGEPGKVGSITKLVYKQGKREFDLIETILVNNRPHEFTGQYVHTHMENNMENLFTAVDENTTKWVANIDYYKLNGIMIKVMVFIMPGMFKKQTQKWLNQFKTFAEGQ